MGKLNEMIQVLRGDKKPVNIVLAGKGYKLKPLTLGDLMEMPEIFGKIPKDLKDKKAMAEFGIANFGQIVDICFPEEKIDVMKATPAEAVEFIKTFFIINKVEQIIKDFTLAANSLGKAMELKLPQDA